ncbi:hypothetical protein B484DRAFT_424141 [Ochromonadaceae sp. CCMP2298]|nr:hypothetical protein B484DRAFT_424141 [Ochromonadaceae sp. CCMP2298]|mmetsp:Transcript_4207/g.9435  ORF Transcript_4207/g.9435 Transcript_4207/m.9435 type:complete len:178 (-) Transcript_4207:199-732(-)
MRIWQAPLLLVMVALAGLGGAWGENAAAAAADASPEPGAKLTFDEVKKKSVKELRKMLQTKGLACKGCSEKADFVTEAFASQDLPDAPTSTSTPPADPPSAMDKEKMDELMDSLKKGGFGGSRMFSADDLKGMSPEEMSEKLGGKKKRKGKKGKGVKKEVEKEVEVEVEEGSEHIEL